MEREREACICNFDALHDDVASFILPPAEARVDKRKGSGDENTQFDYKFNRKSNTNRAWPPSPLDFAVLVGKNEPFVWRNAGKNILLLLLL